MERQPLTLYKLNVLVRQAIEQQLPDEYWVEAELSECREAKGHCYMELVQKDTTNNTPIAKASAKCWRQTWSIIASYFQRITGQPIRQGLKVLLCVYPQFHEAYGFSWIVTDIDPNYTLGDMARRRMEIIARLKDAGVYDLNKQLEIPLFAQRIAVISSENAAGYGDFFHQIRDNEYGFRFNLTLFSATMQGEAVEQSIISALDAINARLDEFDCVVIIRGGGATSDMSGFDTYCLAENVANFPLPIITGIGHDRDESVLDMVAHTSVKTPTAAAAFLISNLRVTSNRIEEARLHIISYITHTLNKEQLRIARFKDYIPSLFRLVETRQQNTLTLLNDRINRAATLVCANEKNRIALLSQRVKSLDPTLLLKRGYSITTYQGKTITDINMLKTGEEIETRLQQGTIKSKII